MITGIYNMNIAGTEHIKYVRDRDEQTGEERLLQPHELVDPYHIEVGDQDAYKVSLLSEKTFKPMDVY